MTNVYKLLDQRLQVMSGKGCRFAPTSDMWVENDLLAIGKPTRIRCLHPVAETVVVGSVKEKVPEDRNYNYSTRRTEVTPAEVKDVPITLNIVYQGSGTVRVDADTKVAAQAIPPKWLGANRPTVLKRALVDALDTEEKRAQQVKESATSRIEEEAERHIKRMKEIKETENQDITKSKTRAKVFGAALKKLM